MTPLIDTAIKVALVLFGALVLQRALRRQSAALRHWVLAAAMLTAAALPLIALIAPGWSITRPGSWTPTVATVLPQSTAPVGTVAAAATETQPVQAIASAAPPRISATTALLGTWALGALASLLVLVIGSVRLMRLASAATPVTDPRWLAIADEISARYGLRRRVQLLHCDNTTLLATWGLFRPKVIMPTIAADWTIERARIVIGHELAHVKRSDWAFQIVAELLRAIYWFNPLLWITCRRLRGESEQAADDQVLALDIHRTDYAAHLVALAREVGSAPREWLPTQAMAHTTSLERRVTAMLNDRLDRRPLTVTRRTVAGVVLVAFALALAGFDAAAQVSARFSGALVDPTGASLPGVKVIVTHVNTQAKQEVQSDRQGQFAFASLAPGEYLVETELPGFQSLNGKLLISGQDVQQNITLQVGTLRETVTVSRGSGGATPLSEEDRLKIEARKARTAAEIARSQAARPSGSQVGGNIRVPMKTRHVSPYFPAHLLNSQGGVVVLTARIGTTGRVDEIKVVSSTHADFTTAATEAVHQWEFDPTLLNGTPIAVDMVVTVNFVP